MSTKGQSNQHARPSTVRTATWLAALALAFLLGQMCGSPAGVHGDVRKRTNAQSFKSGAALNEPLLREISTTLKRIDARLERLEQRMEKRN